MTTIQLDIPEDLAERLTPYRDHLPELLELGLEKWQEQRQAAEADRLEALLYQLAATGKAILPEPEADSPTYVRNSPVKVSGQPTSEIVIQQRGNL